MANGSPVIECGEFYIVGMAPFSEARIIDVDGFVRGNVTMDKLDVLGDVNQIPVSPEMYYRPRLFSSKNFDGAGFWIEKDLDEDGGLK